jgi:hypothetical protein
VWMGGWVGGATGRLRDLPAEVHCTACLRWRAGVTCLPCVPLLGVLLYGGVMTRIGSCGWAAVEGNRQGVVEVAAAVLG